MAMLPGRTWKTIQARASKLRRAGRKFSGPNGYEIRGDVAIIFLEQRNGATLERVVSANRVEEVVAFGRWHVDFVDASHMHGQRATAKRPCCIVS